MKLLMLIWLTFLSSKNDIYPKQLDQEIVKITKSETYTKQKINISNTLPHGNKIHGQYFSVQYNRNSILYVYIGRVKSCRASGCTIPQTENVNDEYEYFDYFILFDASKKIILTKIYNYEASHGQEITTKGWLKQFINYDSSTPLEVGKNIDAISGATISVYAIVNDIEEKTKLISNYLN